MMTILSKSQQEREYFVSKINSVFNNSNVHFDSLSARSKN
jgi:hypothetical protein